METIATNRPPVPCPAPAAEPYRLALEVNPSVARLARWVKSRSRTAMTVDELAAEGRLALCRSAASFDRDRGVRFSTFVRPRIVGAMLDAIRSDRRFVQRHLSGDRVEETADREDDAPVLAVDAFGVRLERLEDGPHAVTSCRERHQRAAALAAARGRLPERERRALELRFERGFDRDAMARALGVSRATGGRLLVRAVAQLIRELDAPPPHAARPARLHPSDGTKRGAAHGKRSLASARNRVTRTGSDRRGFAPAVDPAFA